MSSPEVATEPAPSGYAAQVQDLYSALVQKVYKARPNEDLTGLEKAFHLAVEAHKHQSRDSGEPYVLHPLHVAHILADMQMDMVCLECGLPHNTVEDTSVKLEDIKRESATRSPAASTASPSWPNSSCTPAKTTRPKASARCCSPWSPTSASSW